MPDESRKPVLYGPNGAPLDTQSIRENKPTPNASAETNIEAEDGNNGVPPTPGVPPSPPAVTHHHITYQPEKDWRDKTKFAFEVGGIVLLAIYTLYTIKMYCANKQAAEAATNAANAANGSLMLTRNSLRATGAGVIFPNIGFQQGSGVANIVFENRGKGNAWSVSATYRITVVSLHGDKPITTMKSKSVTYDVIIPGDGPNEFTIIDPYTRHDLDGFNRFDEGVKVEGTVQYNNSFEDVSRKGFCLIAMLGNGIPCADLKMRLRVNSDPFDLNIPKVPDYYRQYRQKQTAK